MSARSLLAVLGMVALSMGSVPRASAQTPAPSKESPPAKKAPATQPAQQKRFASAEEATQAFVTALRASDAGALVAILGPGSRALISSGDPVADRRERERFLRAYDEVHSLVARGADAFMVRVGKDDWDLPIPVVKDGDRWRFDTVQGREEILNRRIGRNELNTMQVCLAYVDAQREYYSQDRTGTGILEYAQKFASTPGKRDGLYWPTKPGEPLSPLGGLVARARADDYRRGKDAGPIPYHGYFFRILTRQGPSAPDGVYNYVVRGHMMAGFGLVAYPATYGVSGVMSFIVNHDGVVYEKDLGPNTASIAKAMGGFDPDPTWKKSDVLN